MSCFYPLGRKIKGEIIYVPCGRCVGCRLDLAKDWAVRCVHEAQMHEENCFVTLTYNNENLPKGGTLKKVHFQKFIRKLRKKIDPIKIRYYGCGEYGEDLGRPHYHILIFGYSFSEDKYFHYLSEPKKKNRFSEVESYPVYRSPLLEKIWKRGFSEIGSITLQSAGYAARYVRKKIGGEIALKHYDGKIPEFALMSTRKGIGYSWIKKYWSDVYPKDFFHIEGKRFKPPKYYDNYLMKKCFDTYYDVKMRREAKVKRPDIVRRMQKKKYLENVTNNLYRSLENE